MMISFFISYLSEDSFPDYDEDDLGKKGFFSLFLFVFIIIIIIIIIIIWLTMYIAIPTLHTMVTLLTSLILLFTQQY